MKYVLMFTNDADLEQTVDPARAEEVYKKIFQWFEQGFGEGWIVNGGAELQPPSTATTVRHGDDGPVVTDGPYVELKEVVGHHPGEHELLLAVGERRLMLGPDYKVSASSACRSELSALHGAARLVA